jgi:large subunit ribosomal protein L15
MFQLNNLKPDPGARRKNKRVGRGPGSGHGKTATKGMKGHNSRSGGGMGAWFEGGQMPLYRRIPKRGFSPRSRVENSVVNLDDLERLEVGTEVTVEALRDAGLVSGPDPRVKILARGEVAAAWRFRVHAVSDSARRKIEAKGGSIELVEWTPAGGPAKREE